MKKLFLSCYLLSALFIPLFGFVTPARAAAEAEAIFINGDKKRPVENCYWDKTKPGVLVDFKIVPKDKTKATPGEDTLLNCYVRTFLAGNSALIVAIAVIIVVFSGVQYMLALGNSSTQGQAKQRIVSILTGIVFLTLIQFFLRVIGT